MIEIHTATIDKLETDGYFSTSLIADSGKIACRYYRARATRKAIICVGGAGGGWDTPANNLYPELSLSLKSKGISALRLRFRNSTNLYETKLDILAAITFLEQEGIRTIGLIGHSFGGAAIIQAAAEANKDNINVLITLASQSYGAEKITQLKTNCAKLFIHGDKDEILPAYCSSQLYKIASEPKQLVIYPGTTHELSEAGEEIFRAMSDWIIRYLR